MTRNDIAQWIVDQEARRDKAGNIRLYPLPKNDGGGTYEYAGINDKYHPKALARLAALVKGGKHKEAEKFARDYIASYVQKTERFSTLPSVDLFLCDCAFNRGPAGAVKILQLAIGVKPDGNFGPITEQALELAEREPALLLAKLRKAREIYENLKAPGRANLRPGLINRWNNAFAAAQQGGWTLEAAA